MHIDAKVIAVKGIQEHGCIEYVEKKWSQDTALLSTVANCERFREPGHINHSSSHAIMERFDDVHKLVRTTKFSQKCPLAIAADGVKCFCQVNECQVKFFLLLATFSCSCLAVKIMSKNHMVKIIWCSIDQQAV